MRFISYIDQFGTSSVGAQVGLAEVVDLRPLIATNNPGLSPIRNLLVATAGRLLFRPSDLADYPRVPIGDIAVAPLVPDPSKIIGAQPDHPGDPAEMNRDGRLDHVGLYLKVPSTVLGHRAAIFLPDSSRRFDHQGELAVVIGRTAHDVSARDAMSFVAGYTCVLDISMRGLGSWSPHESPDTRTTVGPRLVTTDELGDVSGLRLRTYVSGVKRQDAPLADLMRDVPGLVSAASSVMTLLPGDIISIGPSAGVGPVLHGDWVTVEIDRVGMLSVSVSAASESACATGR